MLDSELDHILSATCGIFSGRIVQLAGATYSGAVVGVIATCPLAKPSLSSGSIEEMRVSTSPA
jgi:hypothetical protein